MFDTALQIILDFLLARIHAGPFRGRSEGKRVKVRRDIAGAARVTIVPPGAADLAALFHDEKGFHAGFEKLDAHANAGKASADDEDVDVSGRVCGLSGGVRHARVITS